MRPLSAYRRPWMLTGIVLGFSVLALSYAMAGDRHYYSPVKDPLVKEECGSCHLAFSPAMLPASSWRQMMGNLKNHFGDDARVDAQTAKRITEYLLANAADAPGHTPGKLLRGVNLNSAPQRITLLPQWVHKHRKVPDWEWRHKDVRSKTNCLACHADAESGRYDE